MNEPAGEAQVARVLNERRPLMGEGALPKQSDVVIIGGGIVGCSTAYFLAKRGVSVSVFEKGRVACEQSGRNWGWVRQQGRAAQELPMMMRANAIWRQWQNDGIDTGFAQGGCLYLANTQEELDAHAEWLKIAVAHDLETQLISGEKLSTLFDGANTWAGALYTPGDGRAEPGRAVPALARAALASGAQVIEQCAVRGVESQGGRVSAVVTERGTINTSQVVCAAGAWTSLFAGAHGITVPQLKIKGTVARTAPAEKVTDGTIWAPDIAIRHRNDGGYTVAHGSALEHTLVPNSFRFARKFMPAFKQEHGAARLRAGREFFTELFQRRTWPLDKPTVFEKQRVLHPAPSASILKEMRTALDTNFPALKGAQFAESWAGMIEASPDMIPMIGPCDQLPGFYVATGFSGHGFGLGPGAGEALAKMITGEPADFDMHAFRLSRYFDGSKIELGPTL